MKAFLYETNEHDQTLLGSDHATVTNEYKTFDTLYRYAVVPFLKTHHGRGKALIYYNWTNRYGEPDKVMTWNWNSRGANE